MSDEVQNDLAAVPAPEPEPTAVPEPEAIAPETEESKPAKVFTQEELDAAIGKRLAREQRKWEREQARRAQEAPAAPAELPPVENFNSVDEYADALAIRKAEELLAKREADRERMSMIEAYQDQLHAWPTIPLPCV